MIKEHDQVMQGKKYNYSSDNNNCNYRSYISITILSFIVLIVIIIFIIIRLSEKLIK